MATAKEVPIPLKLTPPQIKKMSSVRAIDSRISMRTKFGMKSPQLQNQNFEEERSHPKVFLYLNITNINFVPPNSLDLKLELTHRTHQITKLQETYTTRTDFNFSELKDNKYPIFTVAINKDKIEDITDLSDNPLLITIYELKIYESEADEEVEDEDDEEEPTKTAAIEMSKKTTDKKVIDLNKSAAAKAPLAKEEEEEAQDEEDEEVEEEAPELRTYWEPILQGKIDLLQFFSDQRTNIVLKCHLFPLQSAGDLHTAVICCKVYSLQPLLQHLRYTNLAFITLESIYNAPEEIMNDYNDLVVTLSYQSKIPMDEGDGGDAKKEICSFTYLERLFIEKQPPYIKWETIKDPSINNINNLGTRAFGELNLYNIFKKLHGTEGIDFQFNEISFQSEALVCNSLHRYALSYEMVKILLEVITNDEQSLLIEVYRERDPENILLQGTVELQIFLYPLVNAMRFAVCLQPPNAIPLIPVPNPQPPLAALPKSKQQSKNKLQTSETTADADVPIVLPTFAILNICLLSPITQNFKEISLFGITKIPRKRLRSCHCMLYKIPARENIQQKNSEHLYGMFDTWIFEIARYIEANELKDYHCDEALVNCEMGNLSTILFKLIACDFNRRIQTTTNQDFRNLIVVMYNELSERVFDLISNMYVDIQSPFGFLTNDFVEPIINFNINMIKYLTEAGNQGLADYIHEKIQEQFPKYAQLKFVEFLYTLEQQDFEEAMLYFEGEMDESREDLIEMCAIYIQFMQIIRDELAPENSEIEYITVTLRSYLEKFPYSIDFWILLHCIYKQFNYLPGMEYTRWKYENLYDHEHDHDRDINMLPKSRWDIYCCYKITFYDKRSQTFYRVFENFIKMGWYKFAKYVWDDIAAQASPNERLLIGNLLMLFLDEPQPSSKTAIKPTAKASAANVTPFAAHMTQSNGHIEFAKENIGGAMGNYARLLHSKTIEDFSDFELGILRYSYNAMLSEEWEHAIKALNKVPAWSGNHLPASFYLGVCLYKSGDLPAAKQKFIDCTFYPMHWPDVWAYLALINLKLDKNYEALECWRYANIQPNTEICQDVLQDLAEINHDTIFLYVDMLKQHKCVKD